MEHDLITALLKRNPPNNISQARPPSSPRCGPQSQSVAAESLFDGAQRAVHQLHVREMHFLHPEVPHAPQENDDSSTYNIEVMANGAGISSPLRPGRSSTVQDEMVDAQQADTAEELQCSPGPSGGRGETP